MLDVGLNPTMHEFRMDGQYRRSAWYAFVATVLLVVLEGVLFQHGLGVENLRSWPKLVVISAICLLAAVILLIVTHRWRFRIDGAGIARRRLRSWRHWPWLAFADGTIKRQGDDYIDASRPWWSKRLTLEYLSSSDRQVFRSEYQPFLQHAEPQPVEIPAGDELRLRFKVFSVVVLDEQGLAGKSNPPFCYHWDQVLQARLFYGEHGSALLTKFEIEFRDRTLTVHSVISTKSSHLGKQHASTPETLPPLVAQVLRARVPSDKIISVAHVGPPLTLAECDYRIQSVDQSMKNIRQGRRSCGVLLLCATALLFGLIITWQAGWKLAADDDWILAIPPLTALSTAIVLVASCFAIRRDVKILHELATWRADYLCSHASNLCDAELTDTDQRP